MGLFFAGRGRGGDAFPSADHLKGALSGVGKDNPSKLAEEESYPIAENLRMVGEEPTHVSVDRNPAPYRIRPSDRNLLPGVSSPTRRDKTF